MVADGVLHVTAVEMLGHTGPAGQSRHGAALRHAVADRSHRPQTPQNTVSPCRLTLLPTEKDQDSLKQLCNNTIIAESEYYRLTGMGNLIILEENSDILSDTVLDLDSVQKKKLAAAKTSCSDGKPASCASVLSLISEDIIQS